MLNPITSPLSANIGPRLRVIRDEEAPPYDADFTPEAATVTAPNPTLAILASLGTPALALYHVVAAHAAETGCCTSGYAELGAECGFTERHVIRLVKALEREGYIAIHPRKTPSGKTLPNALAPTPGRGDMRGDMRGDIQDTPRGDRGVTLGVTSPPIPPGELTIQQEEDLNPPNPPRPKTQRRDPIKEPSGPAQALMSAFCQAVGIEQPANIKRSVGQAKLLHQAGVTPDQIRAMVAWLLADAFWSRKGIDLGVCLSQLDKWRIAQRTASQPRDAGRPGIITDRGAFDPWGGYKEQSE